MPVHLLKPNPNQSNEEAQHTESLQMRSGLWQGKSDFLITMRLP
jgi:hypothetical protein